jgi:hypothetical protein
MRRWHEVGVISADDLEAAERRFFDSWRTGAQTEAGGPPPVPPAALPPPSSFLAAGRPLSALPGVLGVFPEPGGSR